MGCALAARQIIGLEQIYGYRYAVSQRFVLTRDLIANVVNKYLTGAATAVLVLPALLYFPEHFLGRKVFIASPGELGPFWLQVTTIITVVSFFRYWVHRLQHSNEFLWALHSYHHRITDLRALNTDVSNPVDFALRNILIFLVLGVIGFDPLAIILTVPATNECADFSLGRRCESRFPELPVRDAGGASMAPFRKGSGRAQIFGQLRCRIRVLGHSVRNLSFASAERRKAAA
jgi:hypothetical protein